MAYIIAEPCVGTCDTACVEVCPVDCIHGPDDKTGAGAEAKVDGFDPTGKMLYIDPEECIDCNLCIPECPVEAIYPDEELPADQAMFLEFNATKAQEWPVLHMQKSPPADADKWAKEKNKRQFLNETE